MATPGVQQWSASLNPFLGEHRRPITQWRDYWNTERVKDQMGGKRHLMRLQCGR